MGTSYHNHGCSFAWRKAAAYSAASKTSIAFEPVNRGWYQIGIYSTCYAKLIAPMGYMLYRQPQRR